jgi:hypothetical protein
MIALQTRNPQLPDPSKMTAQYANMMNMAQQNETSKRQAAQAQQAMDFAAAREGREKEMQPFAVGKAKNEAFSAQQKAVLDFMDLSYETIKRARSPEDVINGAGRLKQNFPDPVFADLIDQTVATLPADPSQFPAWKQQSEIDTLSNVQRLEQEFQKQTTGTEERIISMPKYGRGVATEVPGSRIQAAQGMQYITDDRGNIRAVPKEIGGGFDTPAPAVGTQPSMGAPGQGNTADVVYGFGKYGLPDKPLSTMRMGDVQKYQLKLIDKTRGDVGQGPRIGTGAVGTYQFTHGTLKEMAPKVFGANWRDIPFTADNQEKLAKALYEERKGGNLKDTWAGLPSNRPGQYTNVPWEQVRDKIIKVESAGGGRRTPTSGAGAPTGATGEPPIIVKGSGVKDAKSTEAERRFGTVARNMIDSIKEATAALSGGADAAAAGTGEYIASQIPFYGDEARKFAQSPGRQQFEAALMALLDGVTYVSTGAGVTAAQEISYKNSYIPAYQDAPSSRKAKLQRAVRFISNLKDAAGNRWTPDMDVALDSLKATVAKIDFGGGAAPKAGPRTPTKVDRNNPLLRD